jgi:UDP-N-acetylglucosamine 1-carboxyvinyltransferase
MDKLKIQKAQLQGQVRLSGAKNSGLKLLTASVLTDEPVEISNAPNGLLDMQVHIKMLNKMGAKIKVFSRKCLVVENVKK